MATAQPEPGAQRNKKRSRKQRRQHKKGPPTETDARTNNEALSS